MLTTDAKAQNSDVKTASNWARDGSPPWPPGQYAVQVPAATTPSTPPPKYKHALNIRLSVFSSFRILWDKLTEPGSRLESPGGLPDLRLPFRDMTAPVRCTAWLCFHDTRWRPSIASTCACPVG